LRFFSVQKKETEDFFLIKGGMWRIPHPWPRRGAGVMVLPLLLLFFFTEMGDVDAAEASALSEVRRRPFEPSVWAEK
jgi:hypothetical protein